MFAEVVIHSACRRFKGRTFYRKIHDFAPFFIFTDLQKKFFIGGAAQAVCNFLGHKTDFTMTVPAEFIQYETEAGLVIKRYGIDLKDIRVPDVNYRFG